MDLVSVFIRLTGGWLLVSAITGLPYQVAHLGSLGVGFPVGWQPH